MPTAGKTSIPFKSCCKRRVRPSSCGRDEKGIRAPYDSIQATVSLSLTWADYEELLAQLGFSARIEIVTA